MRGRPIDLTRIERVGTHSTMLEMAAEIRWRFAAPRAAGLLRLVEVAGISRVAERRTMLPLYAVAGIAEVCILDLKPHAVEVITVRAVPAPAGT